MNFTNLTNHQGGEPDARKFIKKWNDFKKEFVYKDIETKKIYLRNEFFIIRLTEEVIIVNDNELPPDDEDVNYVRAPRGCI